MDNVKITKLKSTKYQCCADCRATLTGIPS